LRVPLGHRRLFGIDGISLFSLLIIAFWLGNNLFDFFNNGLDLTQWLVLLLVLLSLETDNSNNLANVVLDSKELIHETPLERIIAFVVDSGVTETLKHNKALVSARFCNLLLQKLHDQRHSELRG